MCKMTQMHLPHPMKQLLLILQVVLLLAVTSIAGTRRAEHVFIISFDQGAPSGIEKSDMPLFKQMAAEGAHTWEAYTIVPSITLPSHTSMLTGVGIQKHQILWNNYQPDKGFVKVPTVFSLAKEHGQVTAMFVAKEKFKTLALPGSVDEFVFPPKFDAQSVANAFAAEVGKLKPNLCFIHFGDPDVAGHKYGVFSPEKMKAFADCDAALKTIRDAVDAAGLTASSVFILTADHGCHDTPGDTPQAPIKGGAHGSPETADVQIPWIAWGKGVKPHSIIGGAVVIYDTAATALWLLGIDVPESFWGRPVTAAFQADPQSK